MPSEYLPILTPIGGLFVALLPLRLTYIEKQFEKVSGFTSEQKSSIDCELQKEIKKSKPEKEKVLSLANQIATFQHLEKDIRMWMSSNRKHVVLDLIALSMVILLGASLVDPSPLGIYSVHIAFILLFAGFFSVVGFMSPFFAVHNLKNKKYDGIGN